MTKNFRNESFFKKPKSNKNLSKKKIIRPYIKNNYNSLYKITVISILTIFSFAILPSSIVFLKKNFEKKKIIINASKQTFDKTIKNKSEKKIINNIDNDLVSKNVYDDIDVFGKNEDIVDPPRLDATIIEQMFEDTKYDLKKIKQTKIINIGNQISRLPTELKHIQSVKKRKELFIQIVLPLIVEENARIKFDRKKLFVILNKNNNSKLEREWLSKKLKQYGVKNNDLSTLKIRMDEIPVSLAIAQAAKETGWGSSRFAQEGNALFGQWTWSGEGIRPAAIDKGAKHKVAKFKILKASVKAYQRNLNTHPSYKSFRKERAIQRDNDGKLNSLKLVIYLDKYAETGVEYTKILKKIIRQNSLSDYDDVKILPTSLKMKQRV